jgi:hypothetical protein
MVYQYLPILHPLKFVFLRDKLFLLYILKWQDNQHLVQKFDW